MLIFVIDFKRARGYSAVGTPLHATMKTPSRSSYTISLLTNINIPNGFSLGKLRCNSNTSHDFFEFVFDMVWNGSLTAGDYFICDNASIHYASDTSYMLSLLLDYCHIKLIFLPTYSPELNPCELAFAQIKKALRTYRSGVNPFWIDLSIALTHVDVDNIIAYYNKCIKFL